MLLTCNLFIQNSYGIFMVMYINFSHKIPQEIVLQKNQGAGQNHQNLGHQKLGQLKERSGREEAQDHGNKSHYVISAC